MVAVDDVPDVIQVDEKLDGLVDPSSSQVWWATKGHTTRAVAAAAAKRALEAGGGPGGPIDLDDLTDVDTAGGSEGDVLTQQNDGSFALEAPSGGSQPGVAKRIGPFPIAWDDPDIATTGVVLTTIEATPEAPVFLWGWAAVVSEEFDGTTADATSGKIYAPDTGGFALIQDASLDLSVATPTPVAEDNSQFLNDGGNIFRGDSDVAFAFPPGDPEGDPPTQGAAGVYLFVTAP